MPIPATKYIWFNGKLVPWEKATVHVLSHALHYGSSVFEGVRAYETPRGPAIFRLRDHTRRLFDSAKIYRIHIPFTEEQLSHAQREVIAQNGLARGAYLRPVACVEDQHSSKARVVAHRRWPNCRREEPSGRHRTQGRQVGPAAMNAEPVRCDLVLCASFTGRVRMGNAT